MECFRRFHFLLTQDCVAVSIRFFYLFFQFFGAIAQNVQNFHPVIHGKKGSEHIRFIAGAGAQQTQKIPLR